MTTEQFWIIFGLTGQLLFTGRFVVQWLSSERHGRSVVPPSFWYLSLGGASVLLTYAVYRADPVFILGQSFGFLVYIRNLQFLKRERNRLAGVRDAALTAVATSGGSETSEVVAIPMSPCEAASASSPKALRSAA